MTLLRKYVALIELAESSETGRLLALQAIMEAVKRWQEDLQLPAQDVRIEELLRALSDGDLLDESRCIDAFQRRLDEVALPGLEPPIGWN